MNTSIVKPISLKIEHVMILAIAFLVVGATLAYLLTVRVSIDVVARPTGQSFQTEQVRRGGILTSLGSCSVCHTKDGGTTFAGGRGLATPFGTIYTTNITPDLVTGIGAWSKEAFRRAMKEGVSRDGHHLYPALPYEHFTHTSDEDLDAIYAYLMTRQPVALASHANHLIPPLGFRPLLAAWKLMFLHQTPYRPDPSEGVEWNRGAYLVDSLGHCGGCHTPRNVAGGERRSQVLSGGEAEGWNAPALNSSNPQAATWTVDGLVDYLRNGMESRHGIAGGPMGPVSQEMSEVPQEDVHAIAVFVMSSLNPVSSKSVTLNEVDEKDLASTREPRGAAIFAGACSGCHEPGAPMAREGRPLLGTSTTLLAADPDNTVQALLSGIRSPSDAQTPYMPSFRDTLSDEQMADVAAYLRVRFTRNPAWQDVRSVAAHLRKEAS